MRWLTSLLVTLLLVASLTTAGSAAPPSRPEATTGDLKAWTAEVPSGVVAEMRESGIDVTAEEVLDGATMRIEVVATAKELAPFEAPDAQFGLTRGQRAVDRTPDVAQGDTVFRGWDGPDGIEAELVAIADANPDLVKLVDIGDTVQGRDIWAVKVSADANTSADGSKPAVLYNANQHAREWITVEMTRRLLRHYLDNYGSDDEITRLVDDNELWFVVSANPDGYQWTHEDPANRLWRKNLRDNDGDGELTVADGVDLNRNFGYKWGYDDEGSSPATTSQVYRGPGPQSEPETQAMDDFLAERRFAFLVNYHSAAELILYGVGWQVDTQTPDDLVTITLAGDDANPGIPTYDPDQSAELYITNGDTTGHAHSLYDTVSFTPEMSTCQTASDIDPDDEWEPGDCQSVFSFPDDEGLVEQEFQKNLPFALDIARSAADPGNPVSHLGNVTPRMVVDEFAQSNGRNQPVQVTVDRELNQLRMAYRINDGHTRYARAPEWEGGERYGAEGDIYYAFHRGTVLGQRPGDRVEVWFEAIQPGDVWLRRPTPTRPGRLKWLRTEPFGYDVAEDLGGDVLVVADTDYGHELSYRDTLRYTEYYRDAIRASGRTWDLYDVRATDTAPDPLAVLSHYDAVVWYTGDNLITDYRGGTNPAISTRVAHEVVMAMRDYMNEGGKLVATGKNLGFQEFFGTAYGENGDPDSPCTSGNCLIMTNDVHQYWLGGYTRARRAGLNDDGTARDVVGYDTPYEDLTFGLDGGDSAMNQGLGNEEVPTGTAAWSVTSEILPVDEFPQFASQGAAEWSGDADGPFEPNTGDYYLASQSDDIAWKRLARTVDLTGASSGSVEVAVSYDTEADWDFLVVEAHTVGSDDWTTLEIPGVTTQDPGSSCTSGWQSQLHQFLEHYQTLNADGTCSPIGTTGVWNAASGDGGGWQDWSIDLSDYAGSEVEIAISYITDWGTLNTGVFVDDASVVVDGATVTETSFEDDLGAWTVPGSPPGSADNPRDWIRTEALVLFVAAVTTEDSVLHGFGFEGISTQAERNEVMSRTLDYLTD